MIKKTSHVSSNAAIHFASLTRLMLMLLFVVAMGVIASAATKRLSPASAQSQMPKSPQAAPELVPFVEWSPLNPTISDTLVITYGVINTGDAPALPTNDIEVRLYFGMPQTPTLATQPSHLGATGVSIAAGQRRIMAVLSGIFAMTSTQDVPMWVWADTTNDVVETNEANNLLRDVILAPRPAEVDAFEDDNGCLQAKSIQMNTPQAHTHWPVGDEDWVVFAADGNRKYTITAQKNGADAMPSIELLLDCTAPTSIASPSVTFITGTQITWDALASGPAYVQVRHRSATYGPNTAYTLTVLPSDICFSEPNDTCPTSSPMIVSGNVSKQGNFCAPNDPDWYAFDTKAGVSYNIDVSSAIANVNPKITRIERADCGDAPQFGGGSHVTYAADRDGPVHVLIENQSGASAISSDYFITVTVAGCANDAQEPNDTFNAARPLSVNTSVPANGCPARDEDWFAFNAQPNKTYFVETMPVLTGENQGDTQLVVYDSNGSTVLKRDDDSGRGLGALTQVAVSTARTLYVKVTQTDSSAAGPSTAYLLSLRDRPCAPDLNEPNNVVVNARLLISGTASENTLCPATDEDRFKFSVPAGTYSLATSDLGAAADTTISLYDANGTTLLQFNDDYEPKGLGSRLVFSTTVPRDYQVLVKPRVATNANLTGIESGGVQYSLMLQADSPLAITEVIPDRVLLNPAPLTSGINTLIVTNRARLEALFGSTQTTALMAKLDELKVHNSVRGEVIDLNGNPTVQAAYADWAAHPNSTPHANAVAQTIRNLIVDDISRRASIQYLVIVGDDRVVPFHRVADASIRFPESTYTFTLASTSVGQALHDQNFLTDDCYSAAKLSERTRQSWCIPLLATGRLVETPADITSFIDRFLTKSQITPSAPHMALVGGYDFVRDSAEYTCAKLQTRFGNANVDCTLIGDLTPLANQQTLQLNASPPFLLQSFNGHGTHFDLGVNMNSQAISANDVDNAPSVPAGGLVWSPACHVGLSVPDEGGAYSLDFAQVYMRRGVNLIANTGYGWGTSGGTAYSEYMAQYLVDAFVSGDDVQIGQALRRAKWKYYSQQRGDDVIHPKVAMQMTLYGLPMYQLHSARSTQSAKGVQANDDDFPSMSLSQNITKITFSNGLLSSLEGFSFSGNALPSALLDRITDVNGTRYALDARVSVELGASIQPRFYFPLTRPDPNFPARSVWIVSATYETINNVTTTLTAISNEFDSLALNTPIDAWDNTDLATVRTLSDQDTFIAFMGQGHRETHQIRLTRAMSAEVYYSNFEDTAAPALTSIAIVQTGMRYDVKVKLSDTNTITRVGLLFTNGLGIWRTQDLIFDAVSQSWIGTLNATGQVSFAVQALDTAGNVGRYTNKGQYYQAFATTEDGVVYLPMVSQ